MQSSIFIARLLGPPFVLIGVALLTGRPRFQTMLAEFVGSPVMLHLAGVLGLLAGMALVLTHNVWVLDWRVIITLIGWMTLVRAAISILRPQWSVAAGKAILDRPGIFFGAAAVDLIIGLIMSYFGYVA